jgi:hypothetical protein
MIIDNFLTILRKEKKTRDEDQNVCFICGLDKTTFDTLSSDFRYHIKTEHNIWEYLSYAYSIKHSKVHIQQADKEILEKIAEGDISWFPCRQTQDT